MLVKFLKTNLAALEVRCRIDVNLNRWGSIVQEGRNNLQFQGTKTICFAVTANLYGLTKATSRDIGLEGRDTASHFLEQPPGRIILESGYLIPLRRWVSSEAFKQLLMRASNPIRPTLNSPNMFILASKFGQKAVIIRVILKTTWSRDTEFTGGLTDQILKATGLTTRWAALEFLHGMTGGYTAANSRWEFLAVMDFISGLTVVVTRATIETM